MKRIIKLLSLVFVFTITSLSVNAQCCKNPAKTCCIKTVGLAQNNNETVVVAYYFHFTRRCETCKAVESVSSDALKELYGGKIILKSINLDEKGNEEMAKKLGVEGQSLLFVKGDRKVDITNDGFMYARTDPKKLKEKIKAIVESLN
jgi:hypothetical protein